MERILLIIFIVLSTLNIYSQEGEIKNLKEEYLGQNPPGMIPEVFAPGIISTKEAHEFSCCFSPDGKEFYFVRDRKLLFTYLDGDKWTTPLEVDFCSGDFCKEPHISGDNKTIYFGSKSIVNGEEKNGIWKAERQDNGWSNPIFIGGGTFLTSNMNNEVYYGLDDGTNLSNVIMKANITDNKFTGKQVVFTSFEFPSPNHYAIMHPCIAGDENFILFSAYKKGMWGKKCDLFVSFKNDNGGWSKPIKFDERINKGFTMVPALSHDGKYLFFLRDGDIYWVDTKIIYEIKNSLK